MSLSPPHSLVDACTHPASTPVSRCCMTFNVHIVWASNVASCCLTSKVSLTTLTMIAVLQNLGFSPEVVGWTGEFLKNHKVCLHFNGIVSEERDQPVGVPQSSHLSSVLSIAYTSPLLHKMGSWNNSLLGMYVDDGILFACTPEWDRVMSLLRARYTVCNDWLRKPGLAIEPEKMEAMFFQKRGRATRSPPQPGSSY